MIPAYAYLRVSGSSQVEGDGFPRQLAAIQTYAANGYDITHVYQEEGVTGTLETMDRPAWSEMMIAILGNGVRTIIVERLDRVARDLMVQEACIEHLQREGITLLSTTEPDLMGSDPTRVLIRQILGALAQWDKSMIVHKLAAARARSGCREGRKPFGARAGEDAAITRIKELRSEGLAWAKIAARLNAERWPSRTGGRWHGKVVAQIHQRCGSNPPPDH